MPRIDVNRSGDMEAFVQVVERGGFSAAAQTLCMTPAAVSKLITRLEARLGCAGSICSSRMTLVIGFPI